MFMRLLILLGIVKKEYKDYKIQSFTFFIPSPPSRASGYREKQFDKLFYEFINRGYEIMHFKAQACSGENRSGMWLVFVVKALNEEAEKLNLHDEFSEHLSSNSKVKSEVEGLYYIDEIG